MAPAYAAHPALTRRVARTAGAILGSRSIPGVAAVGGAVAIVIASVGPDSTLAPDLAAGLAADGILVNAGVGSSAGAGARP